MADQKIAPPMRLVDTTSGVNTASIDASGNLSVKLGAVGSVTVPVSGTFWQATQPVSGTVTANIGTLNGIATEASLAKLTLTQGSTTSGQSGTLNLAAVTTSAPSYTTGQSSPLSLTTAGSLRVDIGTNGTVAATQSGTWNISNISGTISLPTGAATAAKQPALGTAGSASTDVITVQGIASMTALRVDGTGGTFPVSGTVTANIGTVGTLATEASLAKLTIAQNAALGTNTLILNGASVTTSAPTYTNGNISAMTMTTAGAIRVDIGATSANATAIKVDGSAVTQPVSGTFWQATQPVSGTVTANAGTGTFAVSASSLPLPTGAATAAKQPALGTAGSASSDVITVQGIASMTPLSVAVTSGGGETTPTAPVAVYAKSTDLAAGASTTTAHQTTDLSAGTYYCSGFDASSSIPIKAALHTVANGVQSTNPLVVVFANAGDYVSWKPPHRHFASFTSGATAGFDGFRIVLTNLDGSEAADVYSTIYYQTN